LILRGREQEAKYETDILSMKSEMTMLAGEITVLRACVEEGPMGDDALRTKCTKLALENESFASRIWDTERQLVLARRNEEEMQLSLKKTDRDVAQYVLKSEHEAMLKRREEDLIADMRKKLSIGHSDMCKKTSEVVETAQAEYRKDITRLEEDRQHFVNELAASMNEVTRLRMKHHEYGEKEYDVDQGEEYYEADDLDNWYHDETG
jgi:hypothetical protein